MWHIVEPGNVFVPGWHIDAICDHLEAVTKLQIRNLLINMPPRHAKSLLVSVFWPMWEWVRNPTIKWIFASYGQTLSTRDSLKCRRLILHPYFKKKYGHRFRLTSDQSAKTRFDNNHLGYRIATSVRGIGTGEGGDRIVCDDPHNVQEAESEAIRQHTLTWWSEAMSTRGNNPNTFARVIVMQRVHENDLSGHILEKGGYEHLCLPAEYEGKIFKTSIGFTDPRKVEGECLWPERYGKEELGKLKSDMGSYAAAGQLQQRPAPRDGGIIKSDWFKSYKIIKNQYDRSIINPEFILIIQSWDTAFEEGKENDYSVCTTWGYNNSGAYLLNIFKGKISFPELCRRSKMLAAEFNPNKIIIEKKASGHSLIQTLKAETRLPIVEVKCLGDKTSRLSAVSGFIESGRVFIPEDESFCRDFIDEVCMFPNARNDDQVDSMSQALNELFMKHETRQHVYRHNMMER